MGVATAITSLIGTAASLYGGFQQASAVKAQGAADKAQAEANAAVYEAQAKNIREAQKITDSQYRSKANVLRGTATTNAARSGLKISGTTASSISQSIMALQMDNAYEQHNLEIKRINALSDASNQRTQGQLAYLQAKSNAGTIKMNAMSSALSSASDWYDKYWKSSGSSNNVSTWFQGATNKIRSWGNTRLSGGLPTTNQQILNSGDKII